MKLKDLVEPDFSLRPDWATTEIVGLTADSRKVQPGWLFAALAGSQADGMRFIPDAVSRGAAAILLAADGGGDTIDLDALGVPLIEVEVPRRELALMAARFFVAQPETIAAVTGTNGKTSVASFLRQIWTGLGHRAASLGTIGIVTDRGTEKLSHTTPEPVELHTHLANLAKEGVTHLAIEASSHGLEQHRLDGIAIKAAAFTNITRDHLDYHADFEDYFSQKLRLFAELLPAQGIVVVDTDSIGHERVLEIARQRQLQEMTVGRNGRTIRLLNVQREGFQQRLTLDYTNETHNILLPLVGDFQTSNAMIAAGLAIACGANGSDVFKLLETLKGAVGRLEHTGTTDNGAPIFVDYAHTPDALANALSALKPYAQNRLVVVFGCGGDRDRGKRPQMGKMAAEYADTAYVTDDNPRSEDPAAIRSAILEGAPNAIEIGDRQEAITEAIKSLGEGDVLVIAGKGHETGQIVGDKIRPFSDHDAVRQALNIASLGEDKND